MGWRLYFFRRVGEPSLTQAEVDHHFSTRAGYLRDPAVDQPSEPNAPVHYGFRDETSELSLVFTYEPVPLEEEEPPGRADFPYEETPLMLDMDYCQPAEAFQSALREVAAASEGLNLLVQDPQSGPEIPTRPDCGALERSYTHFSEDVAQTIAYLRSRRRNLLLIGSALLFAGLLLLLISTLSGGR